jgi:hypothetical protein
MGLACDYGRCFNVRYKATRRDKARAYGLYSIVFSQKQELVITTARINFPFSFWASFFI